MKLEHFDSVLSWWNEREEIIEDGFDKAKKYTREELEEKYEYNLDLCGYPHKEEIILSPHDLIHQYQEERANLNAKIDKILEEIERKLGGKIQ